MMDSSSTEFSKESQIKLTKKKPIRAENVVESPSETILAFKKTITTVTDKYLDRIKINPVSGAVPTFVRIVIKLLVDLVGEETFTRLFKKSIKRIES